MTRDRPPASVADATLFDLLGVDVERDEPLFEIPLSVGGSFSRNPVFEVRMRLQPPTADTKPVEWTLPLGARRGWRLPFGVLLGQRGWFDRFPTRIDSATTTVEVDRNSGHV